MITDLYKNTLKMNQKSWIAGIREAVNNGWDLQEDKGLDWMVSQLKTGKCWSNEKLIHILDRNNYIKDLIISNQGLQSLAHEVN